MSTFIVCIVVGLVCCVVILTFVISLFLKRERNLNEAINTQELRIDMLGHRISYLTGKNSELEALTNDLLKQVEITEAKLNRFRAETMMAVRREMPYALANVRMEILKDASGNLRGVVLVRNIALTRTEKSPFGVNALKNVQFFRYSMELANLKDVPAELWIDDLVAKVRQKVMHDFAALDKPEPKETVNADPS